MEEILNIQELELALGESLKGLRLQKNLDRRSLCDQAGISMNALKHLEGGQGATVKTLIRVIRALGRQDWLNSIAPQVSINPLHIVRDNKLRQRASRRPKNHGKKEKIKLR